MKRWMILLIVGAFTLAGCAQAFPTVQAPDLPTLRPTEVVQGAEMPEQPGAAEETPDETLTAQPTATLLVEDEVTQAMDEATPEVPAEAPTEAPTATEVASAEPEASPEPTEATSLGSPELRATNPVNVNLASGKVQVVEFFAFW